MELLKAHLSALLGICKLHIQIPVYTCASSPGPLRRMQFSNAYTLRQVYRVLMPGRTFVSRPRQAGGGGGRELALWVTSVLPFPPNFLNRQVT
jgi:hypothetical protein